MNNDLISRSRLRMNFIQAVEDENPELYGEIILDLIDNAPTVNKCDNCDLMFIARSKENDKLLMDIAHSLAIIADNSAKEGNTQESGNGMLRWVHSEAHRVMCPKCGCRVSITAAYEMKYCFKCGARLEVKKYENG